MMKRSHALSSAATGRVALAVIAIAAAAFLAHPSPVKAQSADLVLCDRLAADPADPDKPADVKGASDSRRPMSRPRSNIAGSRRLRRAARSTSSAAPTPPADKCPMRSRPGARRPTRAVPRRWSNSACSTAPARASQGRSPGAQTVRARGGSRQSARRHQSRGARRRRRAVRSGAGASAAGESRGDQCGGAISARPDDWRTASVAPRTTPVRAACSRRRRRKITPARWSGWARSPRGRGGPKDSSAAKAYYEQAAALGNEEARKALERSRCPYVIKDKRGNLVTNLCF